MNITEKISKTKVAFLVMFVAVCACVLASAAQHAAFAASTTDESASTKVTIQAVDDEYLDEDNPDQFLWEAPALIPFVAKASGELICPDASAVQIKNLGSYPIQIMAVNFTPKTPWNIVADADAAVATQSDVLQFNLKSNSTSVAACDALSNADVSAKSDFYMAAKDNNGAILNIATEGKMLRSSQDLAEAKECGSITWTVDVA